MRSIIGRAAVACACLFLLTPAAAHAQQAGYVSGFGGLTFGETKTDSLFGGGAGFNLTDNILVVGEAGYMRDTRPSDLLSGIEDLALGLIDADVRVPGWYGEGGVRWMPGPPRGVRGYVESTAGVVRLTPHVDFGADDFGLDGLINSALDRFATSTSPMLGLGAGVVFQPGALFIDVGYRYKRILTDSPFHVNRFHGAVGVSF